MNKAILTDRTQLKNPGLIRDTLIGISDGLTVPFVLATGLNGAGIAGNTILTAGLAAAGLGGLVLGLAGYFARKQDRHRFDNKDQASATKIFYDNIGVDEDVQRQAVEDHHRDQQAWSDFMTKYELAGREGQHHAPKSALHIALSYLAGGIIPLAPYFFMEENGRALTLSVIVTLTVVFITGFLKGRITGTHPWRSAAGSIAITGIAAGAAFAAGYMIVAG